MDPSGQVLDGRYRVVARVGKGGMGSVYRADDQKLKRVVAVKVMNEHVPDELGSRRRFDREAQAMAMLEHPHCASILDVGMHDGFPYVVMDFIAGQSLDELVAAGAVPIARAVELTRQVLFGLAHAHEHGIIHRDIKPANIVFSQKAGMGDHVKILDFGLAKIGQETSNLTAGVIIGTPSYMAPEQIRGLLLDGRADVYACGVLLFELLTGKKPFQAPNNDPLAICMMHLSEPAPRLADKLPADFGVLEEVVAQALAKNRDHRFSSAMAFANALAAVAPSPRATPTTLVVQSPEPDTNATAALDPMVLQVTRPLAPFPITTGRTELVPDQAPSTVVLDERDLMSVPRPGQTPVPRPPDARPPAAMSPVAPSPNPVARSSSTAWQQAGAPPSRKRMLVAVGSLCAISLIVVVVVATRSSTATSTPATGSVGTTAPPARTLSRPDSESTPPDPARERTPDPSKPALESTPDPASDLPPPRPPADVRADDPVAKILAQADHHLARRWRDGAIDVLVKARRSHPTDARLPYRAGLLYLEKLWWPDGLKQLRAAIALDPSLRTDPDLIHAAVRAFTATMYVDWTLAKFLRTDIGDAARPFLEAVATQDKNPVVRNRARAELARKR